MKIDSGTEKPAVRYKFIENGRVIASPEQLFKEYMRLHNYIVLSLQCESGMASMNSY